MDTPITVSAVELFDEETDVYDIDVEEDRSFRVGGVIAHNSTLDNRTSQICVARDGLVYELRDGDYEPVGHGIPFAGGPAYHFRCRSTIVPITRSWSELSSTKSSATRKKLKEFDPSEGTRASMDGQVPASTTFKQFAERRPPEFLAGVLGKGKADLVTSGKITMRDLIDRHGQPRNLEQLRRLANG